MKMAGGMLGSSGLCATAYLLAVLLGDSFELFQLSFTVLTLGSRAYHKLPTNIAKSKWQNNGGRVVTT